jgi:hypothetical protein
MIGQMDVIDSVDTALRQMSKKKRRSEGSARTRKDDHMVIHALPLASFDYWKEKKNLTFALVQCQWNL